MDQIAPSARITADTPELQDTYAPEAAAPATSMLTRVLAALVGGIIRDYEDEIIKHSQGHSWCDSTERQLNNDTMIGRHTRSLG